MIAPIQIALVLLLAAAVQAKKYTVWVGYGNDQRLNINAMIPPALQIHPSDTVLFKIKSTDVHTVTFAPGVKPFPDAFINGVIINVPIVTPTVFTGPYNGSTLATSGLMQKGTETEKWEVTFSTVGNFLYGCAIHGIMQNGTISVVPETVEIPSPGKVRAEILKWVAKTEKQAKDVLKRAQMSYKPAEDHEDGTKTVFVRMGYFEPPYFEYLGFFPRKVKVHPGDKVQWYGAFFHTVSFLNGGAPPSLVAFVNGKLQLNPAIYTPTGGLTITRTGFINGGLFTNPVTTLTMTVGDIEGPIEYTCLPHYTSEMRGILNVKPKST